MGGWTPGPWKWWTSNSWRRLKRDDRGETFNVLEPFVARDGHPDCLILEADMALIAAAPDLAEALEAMLEDFWGVTEPHHSVPFVPTETLKKAEAALKKAKGEA